MSRRLPSLNQLRAFEAAARHRSFKDGAAELCVTQAAISHQVKALESDLNTALFVRRTRAVELTPDAERLLAPVSRALDEMEAAALEVSGRAMTGEIAISVAPFYANRFLLPRLDRFHARYPGLTVTPHLSFEQADLSRERLDGAVRFGAGDWPGLASRLIHADCVGPVCAPQLAEGRALPLAPSEIAALPLATTRRWRDEWFDWFAAAGQEGAARPRLVEFESRALAFDAALSGNAVCLSDYRLTAGAERANNLVRLHPLTLTRDQGIHLVWPAGRRPDPRLTAFADWLEAEAAAAEGQT